MPYGPSLRLFIRNRPADRAATSAAIGKSSIGYLAWRNLDADRRLALVEKALAPADNDDSPDGYGLAL